GTWEWMLPTGRITWSPSLEVIHGLAPGTFQGTLEAFEAAMHPEDRERLRASVRAALERGEDRTEYRVVRPDGAVRWIEGRGVGGSAMISRRPVRTDDYASDARVPLDFHVNSQETGTVALMVVPVLVGSEVAGLLYIGNRAPRSFTDEDETICVRLAEQTA